MNGMRRNDDSMESTAGTKIKKFFNFLFEKYLHMRFHLKYLLSLLSKLTIFSKKILFKNGMILYLNF